MSLCRAPGFGSGIEWNESQVAKHSDKAIFQELRLIHWNTGARCE